MDDNLFEPLDTSAVPTIDEERNYLEDLVGEGKKFKTVEDLAKGKALADQAIEILKAKLDDTSKELNTRTSLEAFKTELEALRKREVTPPVVLPDDQPTPIDDSKIRDLLKNLLAEEAQNRTTETNRQKVTRVLTEQFGDQAKVVLNHKAQELNMSVSDMQELAYKSPSAFFRLIGASETPAPGVSPQLPISSVNSVSNPNASGKRGRRYYEALKAKDPKKYLDQSTTIQMMHDMAALGKATFENS